MMRDLVCTIFHRRRWRCISPVTLGIGPEVQYWLCARCGQWWWRVEDGWWWRVEDEP